MEFIDNNMDYVANEEKTSSLSSAINLIVHSTFQDFSVLMELLPQKTDIQRKQKLYRFTLKTRQLFLRLIALVKWIRNAPRAANGRKTTRWLEKESNLFEDTAKELWNLSRHTLLQAGLPCFPIPIAIEILTTGTFDRIPACIKERFIPPIPLTHSQEYQTLLILNRVIQQRLSISKLLPQMNNFKIENGIVTFHVEREFTVSLTILGGEESLPWVLLELVFLIDEDKANSGYQFVDISQMSYIRNLLQKRLSNEPIPLTDLYNCLHYFCQSLQMEVLHSQAQLLMNNQLGRYLSLEEYIPGKSLTMSYWGDFSKKCNDTTSKMVDYNLTVHVNSLNLGDSLAMLHKPKLDYDDWEIVDKSMRSKYLCLEDWLINIMNYRCRARLGNIKKLLEKVIIGVNCKLDEALPALLCIDILQPCLVGEQLIITINIYTGILKCYIRDFDSPFIPDLCDALNENPSESAMLFNELRYWLAQQRCKNTLRYFSTIASEKLSLNFVGNHGLHNIGKHLMFVELHKHSNIILIIRFESRPTLPSEMNYKFYIAVVATITSGNQTDEIIDEQFHTALKVQSLVELDNYLLAWDAGNEFEWKCGRKRKRNIESRNAFQARSKQRADFVPELAHVVTMCNERLQYISLANELFKRNILHQGLQSEAEICLILRLVQLPPPTPEIGKSVAWFSLLKRLLSVSIRKINDDGTSWMCEFIFYSSPLDGSYLQEQDSRRSLYFQYDLISVEQNYICVERLLDDWAQIVHMNALAYDLAQYMAHKEYNLSRMFSIHSFSYKELIIKYGLESNALISVTWCNDKKQYQLELMTTDAMRAHSLFINHLEIFLNRHKNMAQLIQVLHETYKPLLAIQHLLCGIQEKFVVIPETCTRLRLSYRDMFCMELQISGFDSIYVCDGVCSRLNGNIIQDARMRVPNLHDFLLKYVDGGTCPPKVWLQGHDRASTILQYATLEKLCGLTSLSRPMGKRKTAPLTKFLGCVYMLQQLKYHIRSKSYLAAITSNKLSEIQFKVGVSLHCTVFLNPIHMQSLHIKIRPLSEHNLWIPGETQILEKFFDIRAASAPYEPTSMYGYCAMLSLPLRILKDFIQIIRLDLIPEVSVGLKWLLRIPFIPPIIPPGMENITIYKSKILFFLQIIPMNIRKTGTDLTSVVLPLVYDINTNITELVEKREALTPTIKEVDALLKNFTQFYASNPECSLFLAVHDLLTNLTVPSNTLPKFNTMEESIFRASDMQNILNSINTFV